jgi:dimethylamine/trimethylamine dehydrogenase
MTAENPYAVLFEPVRIGPVTARNRFYQVPHCAGLGHAAPRANAAMRGVKAEGGWAVVSTEEAEIHPTSDLSPAREQRIWDDADRTHLEWLTEAVHAHGALAAVELVHNGFHCTNYQTRVPPLAPAPVPNDARQPVQARRMDLADIRALRRWHADAVRRAITAGFDIVYVYAGHDMSILQHMLLARYNDRSDAYGGSLENRVRLAREILEDAREAADGRAAVAFRFAVTELMGADGLQHDGEGRDIVGMLAELPDLWDVNISGWPNDSQTTRLAPQEGYQEPYTAFVKDLTSKPVVGVGRFTSPDAMVAQIRRGALDLIGSARPSIADPFLPAKIREGRLDEIRECIGCNVCVASDNQMVPIRCTQNPTIGEEWRRGWHPERIEHAASGEPVLVVGAGPAGLECADALLRRGYPVTVAEASATLGGRAAREARLPGLSSWVRVADHRLQHLREHANAALYPVSPLTAGEILGFGFRHVFLATGARWRRDGVGGHGRHAIRGLERAHVFSPDDIMAARLPAGDVVVYDDEHGYLGGALAEHLQAQGCRVALVTPAAEPSVWLHNTLEQPAVHRRLLEAGVTLHPHRAVTAVDGRAAELACVHTGRTEPVACDALLPVTERVPEDGLYRALAADPDGLERAGIATLRLIGDAEAPGSLAAAVYAGHLAARSFEADPAEVEAALFRREMPLHASG